MIRILFIRIWIALSNLFINDIMATPTDGHTIVNIVSKLRVFFPRLGVMYYTSPRCDFLTTVLANIFISSKALIAPFNIKYIISPLLILAKIEFSISPFGQALLPPITFIRTSPRTIFSLLIILIRPKRLCTSLAIFIKACLFHQYDVIIKLQQVSM